jgi:hypothetical protein
MVMVRMTMMYANLHPVENVQRRRKEVKLATPKLIQYPIARKTREDEDMGSHPMPILESARLTFFERLLGTLDHAAAALGRTPKLAPHLAVGIRGEEEAFFYLRRQGYIIVARSWRSHRYAGDIDLIGWDRDCLCLIEVKTMRRSERCSERWRGIIYGSFPSQPK